MPRLVWATLLTGIVATSLVLSLWGLPQALRTPAFWLAQQTQAAAVFFVPSITISDISADYHGSIPSPISAQKKVKILIMPGHQPDTGGTSYDGVYERDVVVDIANTLSNLLSQNPHYEVMVARTKDAWNPTLLDYFTNHALEIETFRESQIAQMASHLADGSILPQADKVYHLTTTSDAALELYGINKWASDNHYDIVLHLHINDYAGRRGVPADAYSGFTIYVPNHQYSNASASLAIGQALARRLNAFHATSTLPLENTGVVEDQDLIAIGSNNSVDSAALLLEYGYIYEPQFQHPNVWPSAATDYAYQTYLGLQDFFGDPVAHTSGSLSVPYTWQPGAPRLGESGPAIYALQTALHTLDYYPPPLMTFSSCPLSGVFGTCTRKALENWQRAQGLTVTGTLTSETIAALESALGATPISSPLTLR
jgi:N-acetylmuramoyl-L-alanine amidase